MSQGVGTLGELVEGFGNFAVSLGERVKAEDAAGRRGRAIELSRLALLHMPTGGLLNKAGRQWDELRRFWPDVLNSMDDVGTSKHADKLWRGLAADAAKTWTPSRRTGASTPAGRSPSGCARWTASCARRGGSRTG